MFTKEDIERLSSVARQQATVTKTQPAREAAEQAARKAAVEASARESDRRVTAERVAYFGNLAKALPAALAEIAQGDLHGKYPLKVRETFKGDTCTKENWHVITYLTRDDVDLGYWPFLRPKLKGPAKAFEQLLEAARGFRFHAAIATHENARPYESCILVSYADVPPERR